MSVFLRLPRTGSTQLQLFRGVSCVFVCKGRGFLEHVAPSSECRANPTPQQTQPPKNKVPRPSQTLPVAPKGLSTQATHRDRPHSMQSWAQYCRYCTKRKMNAWNGINGECEKGKRGRDGTKGQMEGVQSGRVKVKFKIATGFLLKTEWTNTCSSPVLICMSFDNATSCLCRFPWFPVWSMQLLALIKK